MPLRKLTMKRRDGNFLGLHSNLLKYVAVLALIVCVGVGCKTDKANLSSVEPWSGDPIVQTIYGKVKAIEDDSSTWGWKAIPYAQPPGGELRWKAPQDPVSWEGIREETEYCVACPQYSMDSKNIIGSEDCLYLNIWRPQSQEKDLPVFFWIHGGGNSIGTASHHTYKGANLAHKANMIVVTINYRLGPLGWFIHPAFRSGKEGVEYGDSGNYGLLDSIKALTWVRENIQAFGGDPKNVTIAGESAGGRDVLALLISPASKGLFHKAMAMSGRQRLHSIETAEVNAGDKIEKLLINDGIAEDRESAKMKLESMPEAEIEAYLRSKTASEILACYEPTIGGMLGESFISLFKDGAVIHEDGFETLSKGTHPNKVPLILGSTKEEMKLFLCLDPYFKDKDELYQAVTSYQSDLWKVDAVDDVARKLSSHADQPDVYTYQFLWGAGGDIGKSMIPGPWGLKIGACHALDIPFIFDNDIFYGMLGKMIFTEKNRPGRKALTDSIIACLAQFVRTGNPNRPGSDLPEWKPWSNDSGGPKCILFDADYEKANIRMSSMELTEQGVKDRLNEMEEPMRSQVIEYLKGSR